MLVLRLPLAGFGVCLLSLVALGPPRAAGGDVISDGTIGPGGIAPKSGMPSAFTIPYLPGKPESRGLKIGGNLFHSFSVFDLGPGESATFTGPADVRNILARVTGGAESSIDGTIRSQIAGANLFLMNPKGVILGPHAQLDIDGSFTVTTADAIELADRQTFNATSGPDDFVLTSSPPAAFGFLKPPMGSVTVETAYNQPLAAKPGRAISIVAGNITIAEGAAVTAIGGELSLIAVGTPLAQGGSVPLDFSAMTAIPARHGFSELGTVAMKRGTLLQATSSSGGGRILIRSGRLIMEGAAVENDVAGGGSNRGVDIAVAGSLEMTNVMKDFSRITSLVETNAAGNSGGVKITAGKLQMGTGSVVDTTHSGSQAAGLLAIHAGEVQINGDRSGVPTGLFADHRKGGTAGGIELQVDGALSVRGGGTIRSDTFGPASAGAMHIRAGTATFDGTGSRDTAVMQAQSAPGATGAGGRVQIDVSGALTLRGGAEFTASTRGAGAGGSLEVRAGSILLDGIGTDHVTGFTVESLALAGGGDAGMLRVETTGALRIQGTGIISGSTFGDGNGGPVSVHAGELSIERRGSAVDFIGITALSRMKPEDGTGGRSGSIDVRVDRALTLRDGGLIDSSTFGTGIAGNVSVRAGSIVIDRAGSEFFTGIGSDTEAPRGGGAGGDVTVFSQTSLTLDRGGLISTGTFGGGAAGDVSVTAQSIDIRGRGTLNRSVVSEFSGIIASTAANSTGPGGTVNVVARSVDLRDQGRIAAETRGDGAGGDVSIRAGSVEVASRAQIAASTVATGRGGSVKLRATQVNLREKASITASATGTGTAGNIDLTASGPVQLSDQSSVAVASMQSDAGQVTVRTPGRVALRDSAITAAAAGNGGNIVLAAGLLDLDSSQITANAIAGNGGLITIEIPANGVLGGPADYIIVSEFVRQDGASRISASSEQGIQGTLEIGAPEIDLSSSLAELAGALVDNSIHLQERCVMRLGMEVSSFLVVGRGGVESTPEDVPARIVARVRRPAVGKVPKR